MAGQRPGLPGAVTLSMGARPAPAGPGRRSCSAIDRARTGGRRGRLFASVTPKGGDEGPAPRPARGGRAAPQPGVDHRAGRGVRQRQPEARLARRAHREVPHSGAPGEVEHRQAAAAHRVRVGAAGGGVPGHGVAPASAGQQHVGARADREAHGARGPTPAGRKEVGQPARVPLRAGEDQDVAPGAGDELPRRRPRRQRGLGAPPAGRVDPGHRPVHAAEDVQQGRRPGDRPGGRGAPR